MRKKLLLSCAGLVTAGLISAITLAEKTESLTVPASAEKSLSAAPNLTKLGSNRSIPSRAPEGGYTAPVTFTPTQEQFDECLLIDGDGDGKTWQLNDGWLMSPYNMNAPIDHWCIFPAMNLEGGSYKVTYTYYTRFDLENFSLMLGQEASPEAMTMTVMERTGYSNNDAQTETQTVELSAGTWHFGLHAFSEKNKFNIFFRNIKLEKIDNSLPKSPELSLENYGMDGTLTVTIPTLNIGGETLTASSIDVNVTLDGAPLEGGQFSGAPGEVKTLAFTVPSSGLHVIEATATVDGKSSEPGKIERRFTKIQQIPTPMGYTFAPDDDEFSWCTVINANGDSNTWEICNSGFSEEGRLEDQALRYSYSYTKNADEWLILPAFEGGAAGARLLSFLASTKFNAEALEVCMAYEPTVEALSQNVIWSNTALNLGDVFVRQEAYFAVEADKQFYIAFHAISPANAAYLYVQHITVDVTDGSAPVAPSLSNPLFDGGDGTVTLTFPTLNIDGMTMDASTEIKVDVTLDGAPYGETLTGAPGEEVSLQFSDLTLAEHTVTATSYSFNANGEKIGGQVASLTFKCRISSSFAYQLPLDLDLNKESFDLCLVVDANEDGKTWENDTYANVFTYGYSRENEADDWIITPAIEVTEPGDYEIALTVSSKSASYTEEFEVMLGTAQTTAAMTIEVLPRTGILSTAWNRLDKTLRIDEPGRYYLGIHCVSAKDLYGLNVKKLEFKANKVTNESPAAVTDLAGDGLETGELTAELTFTFPAVTVEGTPLDAETALTATLTSSEESVTVDGKPGEAATARIACPAGVSTVSIVIASDKGESPAASVEVNCGLDRPTAPVVTGVTIAEDNMSAKIDYEAIITGVNGGHVNASNMSYFLFEWDEDDQDWYQVDVTDDLSMTYELAYADEPLSLITLGLQAYNGVNSGSSMTRFTLILGKPHVLPMEENFENGQIHFQPITLSSTVDDAYAPKWKLIDPAEVIPGVTSQAGGYSLYGHTTYNRGDSYIVLPKFSTENFTDAQIEFTSYHHPASCEMMLMAATHGMTRYTPIGTVEVPASTEGWKTFKFPLPEEFQGKKWVEARLYVNFADGSAATPLIDSYTIRSASQVGVEGISATLTEGTVTGERGAIIFTGFAEGENARVITPAGQTVATPVLSGVRTSVSLPSGIYIVTVGGNTCKVAVD